MGCEFIRNRINNMPGKSEAKSLGVGEYLQKQFEEVYHIKLSTKDKPTFPRKPTCPSCKIPMSLITDVYKCQKCPTTITYVEPNELETKRCVRCQCDIPVHAKFSTCDVCLEHDRLMSGPHV